MRILCLTDFPVCAPDRWIWNYLPEANDSVDFLWAEPIDRSKSWGKFVSRYPPLHKMALSAIGQCRREHYDLVVAWEGKTGIPLAFWRRVLQLQSPPCVILTFTPGEVPLLTYPLIRWSLAAVDRLTVITSAEVDHYSRLFSLASSKIDLCWLGMYDLNHSENIQAASDDGLGSIPYIHASGRSARDYATLLEAVDGMEIRTVIHGRGYNFAGLNLPPNVEIGEFVPHDQYRRLVMNASVEIIPLYDTKLPVGSSQIVYTMMMGKAMIATRTSSTVDYIQDGVSGLLVDPGNPEGLRSALAYLLSNPEKAAEMGRMARSRFEERYSFQEFARSAHKILQAVANIP